MDRNVIVTGGASGIGRAAALRVGAAGAAVTVADVDEKGGEAVVDAIRSKGGRAEFVRTDVSDPGQVAHMVARAVAAHGALTGAINAAGVPQAGQPVHELSLENWDRCNAINYRGMFLCIRDQAAAMIRTGGGSIVAVSSAAATKGLVNSADYCGSKAGVTGIVRAAAIDCALRGVRVNALLPGATDTPLAARGREINPAIRGTLRVPVERMASPDEIAAVAVWLLSDDASYVTGASIAADGGMAIA